MACGTNACKGVIAARGRSASTGHRERTTMPTIAEQHPIRTDSPREIVRIVCGLDVPHDGSGDIGIDMESGGAGRPVSGNPVPSIVRQRTAAPRSPNRRAWARPVGGVCCDQFRASSTQFGEVEVSTQRTKVAVPRKGRPSYPGAVKPLAGDRPITRSGRRTVVRGRA